MSPKRLVLFDIDGTLIWGGPLWRDSFHAALDHFYPNLEFPRISFGGKTDIQICKEVMAHAGFPPEAIEAGMHKVVDEYLERAQQALLTRSHEVRVLPGIKPLLESLTNNPDVLLGLLTGNVRAGAEVKLSCVGLEQYFKVGVFGDDHWDRYQLPAIAQKRVHDQFGLQFNGKQIVIIGDTIHDVNCGKTLGVRSIAVGTGKTVSAEELLAQNPDYYFKDLTPTFEVIQAILEEVDPLTQKETTP